MVGNIATQAGPCFPMHCTTCQPQCGVKSELKGQGEETRHVSHSYKDLSVQVVDFDCFVLFLRCKWLHFSRVKMSCKKKRERFCGLLFVPFFYYCSYTFLRGLKPGLCSQPVWHPWGQGRQVRVAEIRHSTQEHSFFIQPHQKMPVPSRHHHILHKGNLHQWEVVGKKFWRATALVTSENIVKICSKCSSLLIEMQSSLYIILYFCYNRLILLMDIYNAIIIWQ